MKMGRRAGLAPGELEALFVLVGLQARAQPRTQHVLRPREEDADVKGATGQDGAANLGVGSLVGSHGVQNDVNRHAVAWGVSGWA